MTSPILTDVPTSSIAPMRLAILQSNYIPWKGYFDIIHDVDLFVFYDDLQYTHQDWRNRNKIKTAQGATWLTIPVGSDQDRLICDVGIPDSLWQTKHWRSIEQSYGRCAHFERYRSYFESVFLDQRWTNLSALNQHLIRHISHEFLGITTAFGDSSDYDLQGKKLDRLFDLVVKTGATTYVSGPAAKGYIDPVIFADAGIDLVWKDYAGYPDYPQRFAPIEHGVTILDLLFNTGPDASWYIWGWRATGARDPAHVSRQD